MTQPDFIIRVAERADASAIAQVHIASSEDAYRPLARDWNPKPLEERVRAWERILSESEDSTQLNLVACHDDSVVGFIGAGPGRRDDAEGATEIHVIHVLPALRGRGVGGRMWVEICDRIRGQRLAPMFVQTYAELRCCSFYEAHGGKVLNRTRESYHGGAVTRVVYAWREGQGHQRTVVA